MLLIRGTARILQSVSYRFLSRQRLVLVSGNLRLRCSSTAVKPQSKLKVNNVDLSDYIARLEQEYQEICRETNYASNSRWMELNPIINILKEREKLIESINSLKELIESNDHDMSDLAKEEKEQFEEKLKKSDETLLESLLPIENEDMCDSLVLEIQAGVGGQEAMLFAQELFNMYCSFINHKGWEYEIAEYLKTDIGGLRRASILVNGARVFKYFKYEGGVHRVQRTPSTEKGGRIHTSTASVAALPQPDDIEINIEQKDLKIETKRSTGAGGQHVNTTDSAVRIVHLPTNISVECQVDRSQIKNRKLAMARLRAILYQRELDSQTAQIRASRKTQVKTNNRNEKIRSYNYNQDRITDHRLQGVHIHNLKIFMEGGEDLEKLIELVDRQAKLDNLLEIVHNACK